MQEEHPRPTVGILYPGDMGSCLGKLLAEHGFPVVTTLEGRSLRTRRLCEAAGLKAFDSLGEMVQSAAVVFSVVPPAAARDVAEQYSSLAHLAPRGAFYVDANPVSPAVAVETAELIRASGVSFVDGAIHGVAAQL